MAELNALSSLTVLSSHYWGLDIAGPGQTTGGVGALLMTVQSSTGYLPIYDANGNVHGLINASAGTIDAAYEYDAFGNTLRESGTFAASNNFRFSTKYADLETGLTYYGMRYYSPSQGRFVTKDPIEEQGGLNLYAFCFNNGVNGYDVLGREDGLWGPNPNGGSNWVSLDGMDAQDYYNAARASAMPSWSYWGEGKADGAAADFAWNEAVAAHEKAQAQMAVNQASQTFNTTDISTNTDLSAQIPTQVTANLYTEVTVSSADKDILGGGAGNATPYRVGQFVVTFRIRDDAVGVAFSASYKDNNSGYSNFKWLQTVSASDTDGGKEYVDHAGSNDGNFYYSQKQLSESRAGTTSDAFFSDGPHRDPVWFAPWMNTGRITWSAQLSVVGQDSAGGSHIIQTLGYGFVVDNHQVVSTTAPNVVTPSEFHKNSVP